MGNVMMPDLIQTQDFAILDWIQQYVRNAPLDWIVPKLTLLGNAGMIWIVLTLICLGVRKWRKCGITMAVSLLVGLFIGNLLLKLLVARDRPCWISPPEVMLIAVPRDYSFPSCHTLSGFAASLSLLHHQRMAGIAAVLLATGIALTRLYLYVHFPSDVLAGAILGISIALLVCTLTDRYLWERLNRKFPELLHA